MSLTTPLNPARRPRHQLDQQGLLQPPLLLHHVHHRLPLAAGTGFRLVDFGVDQEAVPETLQHVPDHAGNPVQEPQPQEIAIDEISGRPLISSIAISCGWGSWTGFPA